MGFRPGAYATVWSVEETDSPNVTKVRLQTQRKNKKTEEWEQDFSGFCRFIGEANKGAAKLEKQSRIKIGDCEVTNRYSKETKKEYVDYTVFSFELVESKKPVSKKEVDDPVEGDIDEDNMPF